MCYDCIYWARYPNQKNPSAILGYCTYWKEDRELDDTCSGHHLIVVQK